MQLKLLVQAERTAGGYWRALRRRWEARVEAGGADALPPGLAVQVRFVWEQITGGLCKWGHLWEQEGMAMLCEIGRAVNGAMTAAIHH